MKLNELLADPINEELYGLFLQVKDSPRHIAIKAESLFNEVYYLCSKLPKEKDPAGNLAMYAKEIETDLGWHYGADLVFPMMYAVLNAKKRLPKKMQKLMDNIKECFGESVYWKTFTQPLVIASRKQLRAIRIDTRDLLEKLERYQGVPLIQVQQAEIYVNSPGNIVGKEINYK